MLILCQLWFSFPSIPSCTCRRLGAGAARHSALNEALFGCTRLVSRPCITCLLALSRSCPILMQVCWCRYPSSPKKVRLVSLFGLLVFPAAYMNCLLAISRLCAIHSQVVDIASRFQVRHCATPAACSCALLVACFVQVVRT